MHPSDLAAAASLAGAHAMRWYLVLLALLLAVEFAAWLPRSRLRAQAGPAPKPGGHRPIALVVAIGIGAAACFGLIARAIADGGAFAQADLAFVDALRNGTSMGVVREFEWVTWFGDGRTLALLCVVAGVVLLARRERILALALVAAVGGNGLLNAALKRDFQRARPVHDAVLPQAHGFSFPSGHASGAVVAYGMLAYVIVRTLPERWHLAAVMAATVLAFSVGWSRIFIEAHFASDVIAAFASGAAWLALVVAVTESRLRARRPVHGPR